jgi:cbb3-type cytochrome oxidase subunit 3
MPSIHATRHTSVVQRFGKWRNLMGLILLEALGAMLLLVLIVWWTMFSGRKKGELPQADATEKDPKK